MIKNRLKSIRFKYEMNQGEFADYLGIRQNQYNRYERQKGKPTLDIALKIAQKLNMHVDDIFYIDGDPGK